MATVIDLRTEAQKDPEGALANVAKLALEYQRLQFEKPFASFYQGLSDILRQQLGQGGDITGAQSGTALGQFGVPPLTGAVTPGVGPPIAGGVPPLPTRPFVALQGQIPGTPLTFVNPQVDAYNIARKVQEALGTAQATTAVEATKQPTKAEVGKVLGDLKPYIHAIAGIPNPSLAGQNAQIISGILPYVSDEHLPLLQQLKTNGVIGPAETSRLGEQFGQLHPDKPNPFMLQGTMATSPAGQAIQAKFGKRIGR